METKDRDITDYISDIAVQVKTNYVSIAAISELLIEKGYFTKDELDSKFDEIYDERANKIINFLATGDIE